MVAKDLDLASPENWLRALENDNRDEWGRILNEGIRPSLIRYVARFALKYRTLAKEAEDIVQEALYRAYKNRNRFDGRGGAYPISWCRRIAHNLAMDRLRSSRREASFGRITLADMLEERDLLSSVANEDVPEPHESDYSLFERIEEFLNACTILTERQRHLIRIEFDPESKYLSTKDKAQLWNGNENNYRQTKHKVIKKLKGGD